METHSLSAVLPFVLRFEERPQPPRRLARYYDSERDVLFSSTNHIPLVLVPEFLMETQTKKFTEADKDDVDRDTFML